MAPLLSDRRKVLLGVTLGGLVLLPIGCSEEQRSSPPARRGTDNAATYAHARDLPQLLRDALPAPIVLTSVELKSGLAVVVVRAGEGASAPYARYEVRDGKVSGPSPTTADVAAPDGGAPGTFALEDVDWTKVAQRARDVGMGAGIDMEMSVGPLIILAAPGGGAVITGRVSASRPRGYDTFSIPAK